MLRNGIQLYDCCKYEVCVNSGQTYIWNTVEPRNDTVPYDYKKHYTTTTKGESKLLIIKGTPNIAHAECCVLPMIAKFWSIMFANRLVFSFIWSADECITHVFVDADLIHLPLDKMAKTFWNTFSWIKSFIFLFKFHFSPLHRLFTAKSGAS